MAGSGPISVKMLKTMPGSEDGCSVKVFEEGEYYFIERELAQVFIDNNWAQRRVRKRQETEEKMTAEVVVEETKDEEEENLAKPPSIQDTRPKEWVGRTLRNVETGELKQVVSVQGNQVFFEDDKDGIDYRNVRKTMEVM